MSAWVPVPKGGSFTSHASLPPGPNQRRVEELQVQHADEILNLGMQHICNCGHPSRVLSYYQSGGLRPYLTCGGLAGQRCSFAMLLPVMGFSQPGLAGPAPAADDGTPPADVSRIESQAAAPGQPWSPSSRHGTSLLPAAAPGLGQATCASPSSCQAGQPTPPPLSPAAAAGSLYANQQQQAQQQQASPAVSPHTSRTLPKAPGKCDCGLDLVQRVCNSGPNAGRRMWSCSKSYRGDPTRCRAFAWDDTVMGGPSLPGSPNATGAQGAFRGSGTAAAAAPAAGVPSPHHRSASGALGGGSLPGSPAAKGGSSAAGKDVCFHCKQPGHWASQCPQALARQVAKTHSASSGQRPGSCFRCGMSGHWSNQCPNRA